MKQSALIIGAGLGGLFTGAILAKEGLSVTIVEKNSAIGGGLQSFKRFGEVFDTGMHIIGGMQVGGNVRRICNYLGIFEQIKIKDVDDDCTDRLYFAEDNASYIIGKGQDGFVTTLAHRFPEEKENLQRYVNALFNMTEKVDLFNLRPSQGQLSLFASSGEFLLSANDFIAKYVRNAKLQSILAYMNPLYGGVKDKTPAYVHAIISSLYIKGAARFVDGSSHFAELLAKVITDNDGKIIVNDGVEWIDVKDKHIQYVKTKSGNVFRADYYISAIHPCTMLGLMDEKAFPKAYVERLNSIPNAHSAFSLYIKMKEKSFPYINHSEYYMTRYDDVWNFSRADKPWPLGFLFMTPPDSNQSAYSHKVLVTAPMPYSMTKQWENTTVGHRGYDYELWKKERTQDLLMLTEELHPGFTDCIDRIEASTPLTIRDYYGVKEGSICGFSKDCTNIALSQLPVTTKIKNLLLTGQNNNLHGICGVPLTAINTCEAILGINYVINKINECAG